jgi:hypothetical protein
VEAGAQGKDLVGEQLLGGGALPPALLPQGRRQLGGGDGRTHRDSTRALKRRRKRNPTSVLRLDDVAVELDGLGQIEVTREKQSELGWTMFSSVRS